MSFIDTSRDPADAMSEAAKALRVPVGLASPLWLMFAGATSAGMAFWWLNRWRSFTNLEAFLPAPDLAAESAVAGAAVAELVAGVSDPVEAEAPAAEAAKLNIAPVETASVEPPLTAPATPAPPVAALAAAPKVEAPKPAPVKAEAPKPPIAPKPMEAKSAETKPVEVKATPAAAKPKAPRAD